MLPVMDLLVVDSGNCSGAPLLTAIAKKTHFRSYIVFIRQNIWITLGSMAPLLLGLSQVY